jgi:hypothetical protein
VIRFLIDPQHVGEALLSGKCLMVEVHGDRNQYRRVTVISRKRYPNMFESAPV